MSVKLTEAQFEGQTKGKLGNSEMRTFVYNLVTEKLAEYLEEHGFVDQVVPRSQLRDTLIQVLQLHAGGKHA